MTTELMDDMKTLLEKHRARFGVRKEPGKDEYVFTYDNKDTSVHLYPDELLDDVMMNNDTRYKVPVLIDSEDVTVDSLQKELQNNNVFYAQFMSTLFDNSANMFAEVFAQ